MSAMQLAKQAYTAFNREKPHSSITEWVEILTSTNYDDEAYDGCVFLPELVDSISIQATGPAEASRAIRKKLKHGNSYQQYRALVILRALVENSGHKFQTSFANSQLTEALKTLATDGSTDPKVKKKLVSVLMSWHAQFKDDPSMTLVANLYKVCGVGGPHRTQNRSSGGNNMDTGYRLGPEYEAEEQKRKEERERREREMEERAKEKELEKKRKEEQKAKARGEKGKRKKEEDEKRKAAARSNTVKRKAFDFEEEKPQILTAIAGASQASINLVNAITLVNTEHDSLERNERVQECLERAKLSRKQIVRYVQLVENEEMIGTLIEANDRIIAAIESYDTLIRPNVTEQDVKNVQEGLAAVKIGDSELGKLQEKQRAAVQRSLGRAAVNGKDRDDNGYAYRPPPRVHPDLQELSFGSLGPDQRNLPPPLRPSTLRSSSEQDNDHSRGSLSDYSDYESSSEETHHAHASTSSHAHPHAAESGDEEDVHREPKKALLNDEEDPFADPFMD